MSSEIESKITELVAATLNVDQAMVRRDTLMADLGADSLDSVALILALEDEFRIDIHDEDAAELLTVGQMIEYVKFALAALRPTKTGHANSDRTLSLR